MKNNETGEFELVMGNRQLLSGFFIVCLLFGVAFAMGYIVGRNSSPSARAVSEMQTPSQAPIVSDTRPAPGGAPVQPAAPAPVEEVKAGTGGAAEPTTQPEQPPAPLAGAPAAAPAASPKTAAESAPAAGELGSGSFWQVVAIKQQDDAVSVMKALKDKGFPALLAPGPNSLTRVLVGPYNDRESLGKAKAELENAGFHPVLKK